MLLCHVRECHLELVREERVLLVLGGSLGPLGDRLEERIDDLGALRPPGIHGARRRVRRVRLGLRFLGRGEIDRAVGRGRLGPGLVGRAGRHFGGGVGAGLGLPRADAGEEGLDVGEARVGCFAGVGSRGA